MSIAISELPEKIQKMLDITRYLMVEKTCIYRRYSSYADVEIRGIDKNGRSFLKIISISIH